MATFFAGIAVLSVAIECPVAAALFGVGSILADKPRSVDALGHAVRGTVMKMSLSEDTGPYFGRPHPTRFQTARLEGAAAAEVTAAVCLLGNGVHARRTTEPPVA
jgi:hypothetical protein